MFHSIKTILLLAALICTTLANAWCPANNFLVCCATYGLGSPASIEVGWGVTTLPSDGDSFGIGQVCEMAINGNPASCKFRTMGCCRRMVKGRGAGLLGIDCEQYSESASAQQ